MRFASGTGLIKRWFIGKGGQLLKVLILSSYNSQMKNELPSDISQLLGGYSIDRFLALYWHKKPLLIRRAMPGLKPVVSKAELLHLAGRDEVESRLVAGSGRRWSLRQGPFAMRELRARRAEPWTLLVQGVNLHCLAADELLRRFSFIPAVRLDDLMISWAADGGGVGPHVDSYDVFLLQASGRRRWRISMQRDQSLLAGAPLKILSNFRHREEYLLEPGDMLYLPPGCAHEGVADGECMTYSIGFRAPSAQELTRGMLEHLADKTERTGMFADPALRPAQHSALLDDAYVNQATRLIGRVQPTRAQIAEFLGCYLSEPKSNVFFDTPEPTLTRPTFSRAVMRHGVWLDPKTRMLHRGNTLYVNGEAVKAGSPLLRQLADARRLDAGTAPNAAALELLYLWYTHGWLHPGRRT